MRIDPLLLLASIADMPMVTFMMVDKSLTP